MQRRLLSRRLQRSGVEVAATGGRLNHLVTGHGAAAVAAVAATGATACDVRLSIATRQAPPSRPGVRVWPDTLEIMLVCAVTVPGAMSIEAQWTRSLWPVVSQAHWRVCS